MIKRRTKTIGDFSMSSMTDIISFLEIVEESKEDAPAVVVEDAKPKVVEPDED